jgi:hypothetical protein
MESPWANHLVNYIIVYFQIFLIIFAEIRFKDLINCTLVSKKWFHIINNDVRIMDRILLTITRKTLRLLDTQSDLTRKYRRLQLFRINFSNLIDEKVQSLLQTVKHLRLIQCILIDCFIFQQIFDICHSLDVLHIDCISIEYPHSVKQHIKYPTNSDSATRTVKYLKVSMSDFRDAILIFKQLQHVNVTLETLAVDLTKINEMYLPQHQYQLLDLFEIL